MSQHPPLVRQWILLRLLSSRRFGLTVREIHDELGVSEKTVRRDLETFVEAGFPLEEIPQDHGRKAWRLASDRNQPGLSFAYDEALALYLGRRFLEPLAGTPFWNAAQQAFRKIRAMLGEGAIKYAEDFGQFFHRTTVGASDYSKKADIIDALMVGIEDAKAVFLTYQSLQATEPVTYDVYPYGLVYHRGALYLVGYAPDHKEIRHWKVDRIADAGVTEFPFPRPKEFDLQEHLRGSFGVFQGGGEVRVKVRFSPTVARYVCEGDWHATQKLTTQKDGSVIADFELSNTEEIKRWILSFGQHAEVLEPTELRAEVVEELRLLCSRYDGTPAPPLPDLAPSISATCLGRSQDPKHQSR
jgi:proteasome accessory factor B